VRTLDGSLFGDAIPTGFCAQTGDLRCDRRVYNRCSRVPGTYQYPVAVFRLARITAASGRRAASFEVSASRIKAMQTPVIAEGLFSYQIGGSERVAVDLALEFSRRGYRVVCFAFYDSDGPMRAELTRAGIRCLDMNYERFRAVSRRITYQWRFWQMLRRERVSALHVHHATALILCGIPARLAHVDRVVMTEHGLHQLKERPSYRRSAARYCRYADEITVVERTQSDYFRDEMHVPPGKLHYVPNGVRLNASIIERARGEMRSRLAIPDGTFAFAYVGRLNPVKDLGTLLSAVAALPEDVASRVRLYLVGEGSERQSVELQRDALGLRDRVFLLGARTNVSEILAASDAFAMSSTTEGLPMALLEAMAAGLPCVATAVGGIPELLGDARGLLVPPGDPGQLALAMASLVRSQQLRQELSARALTEIRAHYALEAVADRYLTLLGLKPTWSLATA
jgi:glycosyltransferase involved in cell wall biosynthesis